nr:hypothetical protein [Haloterrigena salifodinae]
MADSTTKTVPDPDATISRALCEPGTLVSRCNGLPMSTGIDRRIHSHYDTEEDLLAAFLDYVLDRFTDLVHEIEMTASEQRLESLLDKLFVERHDQQELLVTVLEGGVRRRTRSDLATGSDRTTSTFGTCFAR